MRTIIAKPIDFIREVRVELTKVVWPNRQQTIKLTVIVIIVTIIVGFFLLGIDFLATKALDALTAWKGY